MILPLPLPSTFPPFQISVMYACGDSRNSMAEAQYDMMKRSSVHFLLSGAVHLPVRGNVFTKYFNYLIVKSPRSGSCRSKCVLLIAELDGRLIVPGSFFYGTRMYYSIKGVTYLRKRSFMQS